MTLALRAAVSRLTCRPFSLDYAVTFRCGLRCQNCNIWKIYRDDPAKLAQELTIDEVTRIFKSYRGFKSFGITGGEPFLRPDLADLLRVVIRTQRPEVLFITTNGSKPYRIQQIIEDLLKEFPRQKIRLLFSVDGWPDLHDHLRGLKGAYQSLENSLCGLYELQGRQLQLGTITVYGPYNYQVFDQVLDWIGNMKEAYKLDPTFCFYHEAPYYGNVGKAQAEYQKDLPKYLHRIKTLMSSGSWAYDWGRRVCWDLVQKWTLGSGQVLPCQSGKVRYLLNPYGDVFPCFVFDHKIANLRQVNYKWPRVFRHPEARRLRKLIKDQACLNCCLTCELMPTIMSSLSAAIWKAAT